ncbi:MAG: hypothetical protein JXR07_05275 [Reichenbachiella sp.]
MKLRILSYLLLTGVVAQAQVSNTDSLTNEPLNTANNIINGVSSKNITIGGYAQIDYNQPIGGENRQNGALDVHRFVLFMGYKFGERTHFVTEIEFEHVSEVFIEQAFLNYRFNQALNFRAGLMLIPMGIVNEYHETPTFNGVERPNLDKFIVPSTWRELGVGFSGNINSLSLKYQAYIMNGFNGYSDGDGNFRGTDALRKGRQKGADSYISSPNFSTKIDYYGITGLKLGLAGYFGKSQSTAYDNLDMNNDQAVASADSTVVNVAMIGIDARYQYQGFQARAQIINANIGNTAQYNAKVNSGREAEASQMDLGSRLFGYYVEAGYDVLRLFELKTTKQLILFTRYEVYNTHQETAGELAINDAYNRTDVTLGATLKLTPGAALKADYQFRSDKVEGSDPTNMLNFGIGIWF